MKTDLLNSPCLLAAQQNIKLLYSVEMNGLSRSMKHSHMRIISSMQGAGGGEAK